MTEEAVSQDPNLRLADLRFKASRGDTKAAVLLKDKLIERKALPFYNLVATDLVRLHVSSAWLPPPWLSAFYCRFLHI